MTTLHVDRPCILVDARHITDVPAGVGNYARNIVPRMVAQSDEFRWIVVRHTSNTAPLCPLDDPSHYVEVAQDLHNGHWRDFLFGSGNLHEILRTWGPAQITHNLFHISPVQWTDFGRYASRQVTTLHDLIWLDHARASQPSLLKAAWVKLYGELSIPRTLAHSDHVICVSETTARRARAWVPASNSSVIMHGVDEAFFDKPPALPHTVASRLEGEPYVTCVSSDKSYKNVEVLVRAFARHRARHGTGKLVLVGRYERMRALARTLQIEEHVIFTGLLGQARMHAVIAHAMLFVFPSLIEGFGLPPLEAMACGTPTAVSHREPMPTVTGDGAMHFDATDTAELARLITRQLSRSDLHDRWSARAIARAKQMTWEKSAAQTLDVYRDVLQNA